MVFIKTGFVLPLCIYGQRAIRDDYKHSGSRSDTMQNIDDEKNYTRVPCDEFKVQLSTHETMWQSEPGEAVNSG